MRNRRRAISQTPLLIVPVAIAAMLAWAPGPAAGADPGRLEATLVRCAALNPAGPLLPCGTDPLLAGKADIGLNGRVKVGVVAAAPAASYTVILRSLDGAAQLTLGTLSTDAAGNGELELADVFTLGTVGSGDIVLARLGLDQFVTGFQVPASGSSSEDEDDSPGFEAALVRCADVDTPGALSSCGTDPLLGGETEIDSDGKVEVEVAGAAANASYTIVFRSLNGAPPLTLGTLTTDAAGNGELELDGAFGPGTVRSGVVVLRRGDLDQFVTGFTVLGIRPRKFEAAVVRCGDVNTPAALAPCGNDPLQTGHAQIRLDGRVKVEIVRAVSNTSYTLVLRSLDGATNLTLGTLETNPAGNGQVKITGVLIPPDVGAGNLVFRREDADQFVSGFRVRGAHARRLKAALVRCDDVDTPADLPPCGSDPLLAGDAEIRPDGRLEVEIVGAGPNRSYDVLLRPLDGTDLLLGTLATNGAGNGELKLTGTFGAGDIGSGNIVLQRNGQDQFVTGFRVQVVDVPDGHWAKAAIEALFTARITGGCASDPLLYCPEAPVSRAQMAVLLLRGRHGSAFQPPAAAGRFHDVSTGHWAAAWTEQLAREGITAGCGGQNFCPENAVTRAQMAVFILLARHGEGYAPPAPTGLFGDVPSGHWAAAWIEQLAREGITAGCQAGKFCPESPVTRAQMAVFLMRAFGSQP